MDDKKVIEFHNPRDTGRTLVISIRHRPHCYVHLKISENERLETLHQCIMDCFTLIDGMGYAFYMDNSFFSQKDVYYAPQSEITIDDAEARRTTDYTLRKAGMEQGKRFKYIYSFSFEYRFECTVMHVLPEPCPVPEVVRGDMTGVVRGYDDPYWDDDSEM